MIVQNEQDFAHHDTGVRLSQKSTITILRPAIPVEVPHRHAEKNLSARS